MVGLWDNVDSFYYDRLHLTSSRRPVSLRIRSLVGLTPLIGVHVIRRSKLCHLPRLAEQLKKLADASLELQVSLLVFTRESSYCFQHVLAIAILSVRLSISPSVTWVDQSKAVQARIMKFFPSDARKTLVSRTVKFFHTFEEGHLEQGC